MAAVVVADASVLIALAQLDQLSLLQKLFVEIMIPPAVQGEVAPSLPQLPAWVQTRALRRPSDMRLSEASLDPGEAEAISLAVETKAEWIILDDRAARRLAKSLGLAVMGTGGVLFAAKGRGFLTAVRPALDALRAKGFHLRKDVYEEILRAAGENEEGNWNLPPRA